MTNEQREAIKICEHYKNILSSCNYEKGPERTGQAIETALSLIKEQQDKIAKYEKIIDKISQNPFNELRVDGIRFCGEDIKQYFAGLVEKE